MTELESAKYWLSWLELGGTIALFLVAIGVGYEFLANRLEAPFRAKVEAAQQTEIERLRRDTETAKTRAAEADRQIEQLRKETAEANARAAQAALELSKLRQKLAPRLLNPLKRDSMIKTLKLVGEWAKADVMACSGTGEAVGLVMQIRQLLTDAGWKSTLYPTLRSDRIVVGVLVESDPNQFGAENMALGLVQVLRDMGGVPTVHESMTYRGKFDEPIRITIGAQTF